MAPPNGVITFVSKAYPGSTSDKKIVDHSEDLVKMVPGELILADKGILLPAGVSLNIPPFLTPQFTQTQVYETQRIAKTRIHVEVEVGKINILRQAPQYYISKISIIPQLCAAFPNFQIPLI